MCALLAFGRPNHFFFRMHAQATGNHTLALKDFEAALRIQRVALGPDHHEVATTLNNIAEVQRVRCVILHWSPTK